MTKKRVVDRLVSVSVKGNLVVDEERMKPGLRLSVVL